MCCYSFFCVIHCIPRHICMSHCARSTVSQQIKNIGDIFYFVTRVSLTGNGDSFVGDGECVNTLPHARFFFFFVRVAQGLTRFNQLFGLQHFCARHLLKKNLHTARMPCSVHFVIHLSRPLHRAHPLPLPRCSLQIGHQLLPRCLAALLNKPLSQVIRLK